MTKDITRKYKDSVIISRLVHFARPYLKGFILGFVLTLILVIIDLLPPLMQGKIIDFLTNKSLSKENILLYCYLLIGGFIGLIIIQAFINYYNSMLLQSLGQKILFNIRTDVFCHIESLSIAQINEQPVGRLVTRVTSDTATLNDFFSNVLVNFIRYFLTIIIVIIIMFVISWQLTLMLLCVIPVLVAVTFIFRKKSRNAYREVRQNVSVVNSFLSENISGMKVTQIFNQEQKKYSEFKEKNEALKKSSIKEILVFGVFQPTIYVLYVICQMIVIYFGITLIGNNKLKLPAFVSFYSYISSFFNPIQQLAELFNQLQQAFASTEKILTVLDTEKVVLDKPEAREIKEFKGKIVFDHVWFAYNAENWILKDVSFTILPKQTAAFVGATGAGKTTILALIVRNYDIQKGHIYIDDIDIMDIKIESLRSHIGQMLQDVFMFSGSIETNITLRDPRFTRDDVIDAVKYVNADRFIERLPDAYDHKVLERGANFSAGERQLISFARTVIHKPNIMILDEATANIDTETEVLIQQSLEKMMNVGTMLVVAHRLSTIQHANIIFVLKKGQIVESGNHQELLKKKGLYYSLYEIQYKHMET